MAGLIFSKEAGLDDSLFGKSVAPIHSLMEKGLEAFEQGSAMEKIFAVRKSKNYAEKLTALSAMDNFQPVGENGAYPSTDFHETFAKIVEHETWKNKFAVTKEMIEDAKFDLMRIRASKFTQAYGRTREEFAAAFIMGATGNAITYGGKTFATLCADGLPLFSKEHPSAMKKGLKQSNMYAGEFSNELLAQMETLMQNFLGDNGEILNCAPDTIIIPNDYKLKYKVFEAIGADKDPNTSNNGFNYNYGRWNVIVWPYWRLAAGSADRPYILLDSNFNKLDGTAVWFDRVPLSVEAYVDKNDDAAVYKGRARWSAGFNNWRGMILGGVTGGTTL